MLREIVRQYRWVHLALGLIGNICFIIGSVLFLFPGFKDPAIYFFIAGSSGMLIGSLGNAIISLHEHRQHKKKRERPDL